MRKTILFTAVLLCTSPLVAQTEQLTVPLTNPGKPYTLDVHLISGSIHVTSHSGTDLIIEAAASDSEVDNENKETIDGMKKISSNKGYKITANENNNSVSVHNNSFNHAVKLNIKVPQQSAKLKLNTVIEGEISVENITGELELNNVNGPITVTNISGSVVATTVDGDINITFNSVDPDAAMAFSSLSGNISIVLPSAIKANLKLKSDMGEIYSDFDMVIDKAQPKVNRTSQSGMYKLEVEEWVYGKINGGGSELMIKNMQGDIFLRKSK
jgi:hypothetical protein